MLGMNLCLMLITKKGVSTLQLQSRAASKTSISKQELKYSQQDRVVHAQKAWGQA